MFHTFLLPSGNNDFEGRTLDSANDTVGSDRYSKFTLWKLGPSNSQSLPGESLNKAAWAAGESLTVHGLPSILALPASVLVRLSSVR